MSYMQFQQECKDCHKEWTAAFGIVGTTQIATPPVVCPYCGSAAIGGIQKEDTRARCCYIPCDKLADWQAWAGVDDYTEACNDHLGHLLSDIKVYQVYPVAKEKPNA